MKRQGTGRILHFAVTGALLGGMGMGGCASRHKLVNEGPESEDLHVNPGPDEDPGAAEGGAGEPEPAPDHVNTAPVEAPPADEPEVADVNPGPQEPPPAEPTPKHVNTAKTPDPEPAAKKH